MTSRRSWIELNLILLCQTFSRWVAWPRPLTAPSGSATTCRRPMQVHRSHAMPFRAGHQSMLSLLPNQQRETSLIISQHLPGLCLPWRSARACIEPMSHNSKHCHTSSLHMLNHVISSRGQCCVYLSKCNDAISATNANYSVCAVLASCSAHAGPHIQQGVG